MQNGARFPQIKLLSMDYRYLFGLDQFLSAETWPEVTPQYLMKQVAIFRSIRKTARVVNDLCDLSQETLR